MVIVESRYYQTQSKITEIVKRLTMGVQIGDKTVPMVGGINHLMYRSLYFFGEFWYVRYQYESFIQKLLYWLGAIEKIKHRKIKVCYD